MLLPPPHLMKTADTHQLGIRDGVELKLLVVWQCDAVSIHGVVCMGDEMMCAWMWSPAFCTALTIAQGFVYRYPDENVTTLSLYLFIQSLLSLTPLLISLSLSLPFSPSLSSLHPPLCVVFWKPAPLVCSAATRPSRMP